MRYVALACDFDETIASGGQVAAETLEALNRVRASGRRLLLVTGRVLEDLLAVFPGAPAFDIIVAENGAVLHWPARQETTVLAEAPPPSFAEALDRRGVRPLEIGRVVVATHKPNEGKVLEAIRDLGLELQLIFNRDAVMVLPTGVNKGTGLAHGLGRLGLSPRNVVSVGDGENDHALFAASECAVAVANAAPAVRRKADFITEGENGRGVQELARLLVDGDLADLEPRLARHHVPIGVLEDGVELKLPPYGTALLVAGTSGGGKSRTATAILERLGQQGYQVCLIDPEGDHEGLADSVSVGTTGQAPDVEQVMRVLARPDAHCVVNLLGLKIEDRPGYFAQLLARVQELRTATGRPHWLVVDEAHHVMDRSHPPATVDLLKGFGALMLVTVNPAQIQRPVLETVQVVIAAGTEPAATVAQLAAEVGARPPRLPPEPLAPGQVLVWRRDERRARRLTIEPSQAEHRRHRRKYAEGDLGPDRSFYFRGAERRLNLRAHNLTMFRQMAEGVDDDTWTHHLGQGDYSRWFDEKVKDPELASVARAVEARRDVPPAESKATILRAIDERYSRPA